MKYLKLRSYNDSFVLTLQCITNKRTFYIESTETHFSLISTLNNNRQKPKNVIVQHPLLLVGIWYSA